MEWTFARERAMCFENEPLVSDYVRNFLSEDGLVFCDREDREKGYD